jgi:MYXO-CTERM domain-containing protein
MRLALGLLATLASIATAHAQPSGTHPRLWLDPPTLTELKARAMDDDSQVSRAIEACDGAIANPGNYTNGQYQGFAWAHILGACALAWQVTEDADYATAALRYFEALLDDVQVIDDNGGGDDVICNDSGFSMRTYAPYAAIGYDWLHDAPGMTETLRAHARARFKAWTDNYPDDSCGYRASDPGTNYHAGYLWGATLIAIAEGGEAGADGNALWARVTGTIWTEMSDELEDGVLDGGDWLEGWQYGPLAVSEYALAARALSENGAPVAAFAAYPEMLLFRYRHSLTPTGEGMFIGGDYMDPDVNREPSHLVLQAILASHTSDDVRAHARAELAALPADRSDFYLFAALSEGTSGPATPFATTDPTWYLPAGAQTLYSRTAWSDDAVWLVVQCSPQRDVDHQPPNAGNFVLSRGNDDLIVDPSPYGSLSSLTSNAPTAPSEVLPQNYSPSQGPWGGDAVGFAWARQTVGRTVVARCDYANQFAFRDEQPSDVDWASRDFVLWPTANGGLLVVLDRLSTGDADRPMMLRFRSPGNLALAGDIATATRGATLLSIEKAFATTGDPNVRAMTVTNCFGQNETRGGCDKARFAGQEMRLEVGAAEAVAVHVIDAVPTGTVLEAAEVVDGQVRITRGTETFVVAHAPKPSARGEAAGFVDVPAAVKLVVVDAPRGDQGRTDVTVAGTAGGCRVSMAPRNGATGGLLGEPLVVAVAADCSLTEEPSQNPVEPGPVPDGGTIGSDGGPLPGENGTSGGCDCRTSGGSASGGLLFAAGLLALLLVRRRRR